MASRLCDRPVMAEGDHGHMKTGRIPDPLKFPSPGRRAAAGRSDGGRIGSDGGGWLLRAVEQRTHRLTRLAGCCVDPRDPDRIGPDRTPGRDADHATAEGIGVGPCRPRRSRRLAPGSAAGRAHGALLARPKLRPRARTSVLSRPPSPPARWRHAPSVKRHAALSIQHRIQRPVIAPVHPARSLLCPGPERPPSTGLSPGRNPSARRLFALDQPRRRLSSAPLAGPGPQSRFISGAVRIPRQARDAIVHRLLIRDLHLGLALGLYAMPRAEDRSRRGSTWRPMGRIRASRRSVFPRGRLLTRRQQ